MENNQLNQSEQSDNVQLCLSKSSLNNLTTIRKWTMFFAILGFVGIGLMILGGFMVGLFGSIGGMLGNKEAALFGVLTVVYIIFGVIYFFPVLYLFKFSSNMKLALEQTNQSKLNEAFQYLKSHFTYVGILTIVIFGLYILFIIIALLVGISSIF
jgi:hypothetical protein